MLHKYCFRAHYLHNKTRAMILSHFASSCQQARNSLSLWESLHHFCEENTSESMSVNFKGFNSSVDINASKQSAVWVNPDSFTFLAFIFRSVGSDCKSWGLFKSSIKKKYFWQLLLKTKDDLMKNKTKQKKLLECINFNRYREAICDISLFIKALLKML